MMISNPSIHSYLSAVLYLAMFIFFEFLKKRMNSKDSEDSECKPPYMPNTIYPRIHEPEYMIFPRIDEPKQALDIGIFILKSHNEELALQVRKIVDNVLSGDIVSEKDASIFLQIDQLFTKAYIQKMPVNIIVKEVTRIVKL